MNHSADDPSKLWTPPASDRAGEYKEWLWGYWFATKPLPPSLNEEFTSKLPSLLSQLDQDLGRLDGGIHTLPNPDLFVLMYICKGTVPSNQMKDGQNSLQDLLVAEVESLDYPPKDVRAILGYMQTPRRGSTEVPDSKRLIQYICEKQQYRNHYAENLSSSSSEGNIVVNMTCSSSFGATHRQPPADQAFSALTDLEEFLQKDKSPILLKIGLAYAQLEMIHPFEDNDSNGYVGWLLAAFLLIEHGIPYNSALYISHFFKRRLPACRSRLRVLREEGDWEGWLAFFFRGIAEVSKEAIGTGRSILMLRERHQAAIIENLERSAAAGVKLLERLFKQPIVRIQDVMQITETAYPTSNNLVARLVELGILAEITGNARNRIFHYAPYIALFSDKEAQEHEA